MIEIATLKRTQGVSYMGPGGTFGNILLELCGVLKSHILLWCRTPLATDALLRKDCQCRRLLGDMM